MKRFVLLALLAAVSCSQIQSIIEEVEDKVYTESELGMHIDWLYSGWSEVYNDLEGTVTLVATYPDEYDLASTTDKTSVIEPGEFIKLNIGSYRNGESIGESRAVNIKLSDGSEIFCIPGADNAWSKQFYDGFEQRKEYEIVEIDGKRLRHDLIVLTYHIDQKLVDLWRAGQIIDYDDDLCGNWPPIKLDKEEVSFTSDGGADTITALNYNSWWISYGYDDVKNVNGKLEYTNFVYAVCTGKTHAYVTDALDGGWYHAEVPCVEGKDYLGHTLSITVEPNTTGQSRQATIEMTAGDSFTTVKVCQQ